MAFCCQGRAEEGAGGKISLYDPPIQRGTLSKLHFGERVIPMAIQANAIDFIDHVIEKLPFRIKEIRTDNTYENHDLPFAYIKQDTPPRNGKVE